MKKLISIILALAMIFAMSATVFAEVSTSDNEALRIQEFEYNDETLFDYTLRVSEYKDKMIVTLIAPDGRAVQESIRENDSDVVMYWTLEDGEKVESSVRVSDCVEKLDDIINYSEICSDNYSGSTMIRSLPNDVWHYFGVYNTDYLYNGSILKGYGYYKRWSNDPETEYSRLSYNFVTGSLISVIYNVVSSTFNITASAVLKAILEEIGFSFAGGAITSSGNFIVSIRVFEYWFKSDMIYSGNYITTCIIERPMEYMYFKSEITGSDAYRYDSSYAASETLAIDSFCDEAVGYGAAAFNKKYIAQTDPSLSLPVSGPVY